MYLNSIDARGEGLGRFIPRVLEQQFEASDQAVDYAVFHTALAAIKFHSRPLTATRVFASAVRLGMCCKLLNLPPPLRHSSELSPRGPAEANWAAGG